jgi:hypothetical protein
MMKKIVVTNYPVKNLPDHLRAHFGRAEFVRITVECTDHESAEELILDGSNMTGKWGDIDPSELHFRQ